jgi:hypothetical protein
MGEKGLHVRTSPPQNSKRGRIMGCKPEIHLHRIERVGRIRGCKPEIHLLRIERGGG